MVAGRARVAGNHFVKKACPAMARLSQAVVQQYRRDVYFSPIKVMSQEEASGYRRRLGSLGTQLRGHQRFHRRQLPCRNLAR
jgi:hypothetical protein